jgi:transposase
MIEAGKRKAVVLLHENGMTEREIAERLGISRDSVRRIIDQGGELQLNRRKDRKQIDPELLHSLYAECQGWVQRVHEKLKDQGISIGYSTLSRMVQEQGLGKSQDERSNRVPDQAGAEIQHDTSPYRVKIAGVPTSVVASLLYYRYSKQRYLKFYRSFKRFRMKCFFYEALTHYGYTGKICVIDNTNLARLYGTGKDAVFVPEMIAFADLFGFKWLAHEKGHSDRKAGEERSFWTVETNFFPGREFSSLEDMNAQAKHWALEIMAQRPQTKARIIPNLAFETEKPYLTKLPPFIPEPYEEHERGTDQYGYTAFESNFYWVPGKGRPDVKILQYSNRIQIWQNRQLLVEYPLPPEGTKNKKFPDGKDAPLYQPKNRKQAVAAEEEAIRKIGQEAQTYLNWMRGLQSVAPNQKNRLIRELHSLSLQLSPTLFLQALARAITYRITDPKTIDRMACLMMRDSLYDTKLADVGDDFKSREIYQEGKLSTPPDLSPYSQQELPFPQKKEGDDDGHTDE